MGLTQSLFKACAEGDLRTVRHLLQERGVSVHATDEFGWTALHTASSNGHLLVVNELIQRGADIEAKENNGFTPLHVASWTGFDDVLELLLEAGADIHCRTSSMGITPLHVAIEHRHTVATLLGKGADLHAVTKKGNSALHMASKHGFPDVTTELLAHGAKLEARNQEGETPLHLATSHGQTKVAELLIHNGADAYVMNKAGKTPANLLRGSTSNADAFRAALEQGVQFLEGKTNAAVGMDTMPLLMLDDLAMTECDAVL